MKYILITGNPTDGFEYEGPFGPSNNLDAAINTAEKKGINWWVARVKEPEKIPAAMSDKELCKIILDSMVGKEIRHKDGNPRNYSIDNLELVPMKFNHQIRKSTIRDIDEVPEMTQRLDWWTEHQKIERENRAQSDKERLDTKLDILEIYDDPDYEKETQADPADTESYAASLPGIDYHDILDQLDEEDIPL